jgi:hypothetical protein
MTVIFRESESLFYMGALTSFDSERNVEVDGLISWIGLQCHPTRELPHGYTEIFPVNLRGNDKVTRRFYAHG